MMLKHQCVRQLKLGQCNIGCVLMSLNELLFYCGLIISLNLANETHTQAMMICTLLNTNQFHDVTYVFKLISYTTSVLLEQF